MLKPFDLAVIVSDAMLARVTIDKRRMVVTKTTLVFLVPAAYSDVMYGQLVCIVTCQQIR